MTNGRLVLVGYIVIAILGGLFLEHLFSLIFGLAGWHDVQILGEAWTLTTLLGFVGAFGAAIAIGMNEGMREVSFEVVSELRKVTWPTLTETRAATVAVLVTTAVVAVILGGFDFLWAEVTKLIYEGPRFLG